MYSDCLACSGLRILFSIALLILDCVAFLDCEAYPGMAADWHGGFYLKTGVSKLELDEVQLAKQEFRMAKQVGLCTTLEALDIDISCDFG